MFVLTKIVIKEEEAEADNEAIEGTSAHTLDKAPKRINTGVEEETAARGMIGADKIEITVEMVTGINESLATMAIDSGGFKSIYNTV